MGGIHQTLSYIIRKQLTQRPKIWEILCWENFFCHSSRMWDHKTYPLRVRPKTRPRPFYLPLSPPFFRLRMSTVLEWWCNLFLLFFRWAFFKIPRQGNLTVISHISTTFFEQNMFLFSIFFPLSVLVISSPLRDQLLANQGRKNRRHLFLCSSKWREKRISSFFPNQRNFFYPPPPCVIPAGNPLLCLDKKKEATSTISGLQSTPKTVASCMIHSYTPVLPTGHF